MWTFFLTWLFWAVNKWIYFFGIIAIVAVTCYGCGRLHGFQERDGILKRLRPFHQCPCNDLEQK